MPIIFDVTATANFTNPTGGAWQRIFDFGNGAANNNIWAGNVGNSTQMALEVWTPGGVYRLTTATGAIVAGETATWNFTISDTGVYQIFKNGALLAAGTNAATIPADIDRNSNFIGQSNWGGDTPLIGTVSRIDVNTTFTNGIDLTVTNTQNDSGPLNATDLSETVNASASTNAVTIDGAGGNDTITGGSAADRLSAGVGNDSIIGNDGADTIYGGAGNDTLDGSAGNDIIRAGSGNDTVTGGAGADSLTGWSGSDVVYGGDADDTIIGDGDSGAAGTNLITNGDFSGGLTGWTANNPTGGSAPLIYSIGGANGNVAALNAQDEAVYGDSIQQTIATTQGESYDLSMFLGENGSGTGNHTVVVSVLDALGTVIASQTYTFNNATNQTISFAFTAGSASTIIRISNPTSTGSFISDLVIDNVSVIERTTAVWNDTLYGGLGNDQIDAGIGADLIFGEDGNDAIFNGAGADTVFGGAGDDYVADNGGGNTSVGPDLIYGGDGVDNLRGSQSADTIYGDAGDDYLAGGDGGDFLFGGDGNEVVDGGAGNDALSGGLGNDFLDGGIGDDTLYGGDGSDTIWANFGLNEAVFGGAGDDVYQIGGTSVDAIAFNINLQTGVDQFGRTFGSIETIIGGSANDTLTGRGDTSESLVGGAGNDLIYGAGAAPASAQGDSLFGGVGADTIYAATGTATTVGSFVDGGNEADLIYGGAGNDTLDGGGLVDGGGDTLFGGAGSDIMSGGAGGADLLYGDAGNDTLSGGLDVDTLYGGDGNDLIYGSESISASGAADRVFGGAGNDTIFANSAATAAVGSTLDGGDGADVITGSFAADTIAGGLGGDTLYGGDGADLINGDEGADLIYGGAGSDQINFGAGDNTIFGGDGDDNFDDAGGIPALFGNTLIYAGAGNDWLWDGIGNDTYFGGTGNDTLQGDNAGDDSYSGDEGNDSIAGGLGNDLLFGGADNDTVDGGAGRDFIFGGAGNDVLRGGSEADVFSAQGADTITDFDATTGVSGNGNLDNDFVDLRGFYNASTLAAWNAANPGNQYDNALKWLRADQLDGILQAADGLRIQNGGVAVAGALLNDENTAVCFTAGTRLATAKGHRPIEKLRVGDLVETADHGLQPVRWIGSMTVDGMGEQAPILISAGALGNKRDIMVSPLHRMLVSGWKVELLFGEEEVIAAAKMLVDGAGIRPQPMREVIYYHILFDAHEIVFAEGAGAESFHPGEEGFDALGAAAQGEIAALLPHITGGNFAAYGPSARRSLRVHEARLLHMGRKMEDTGQIHTAPRKKAVAAR